MPSIVKLSDIKECIQATFEGNEESLHAFGKTYQTQLKAYLIESTDVSAQQAGCPDGTWRSVDAPGWYVNTGPNHPEALFLDATSPRVWKLYSLLDATQSDGLVEDWVRSKKGLDHCWLSRRHMLRWGEIGNWQERGIGIRFEDGLAPIEQAATFSLKAWHSVYQPIPGLQDVIERAKERFAIHSVRWQKVTNGTISISAEWFSDGKVTINRGTDVDEAMAFITDMALRYEDSLARATDLRNSKLAAFEFEFSQRVNLESFASMTAKGIGDMKLWLVEVEGAADFKRFKGVDLHTWDRVLIDIAPSYAFLTIPAKGCVNAVPRLAVAQGEDSTGKTEILYDGELVFA